MSFMTSQNCGDSRPMMGMAMAAWTRGETGEGRIDGWFVSQCRALRGGNCPHRRDRGRRPGGAAGYTGSTDMPACLCAPRARAGPVWAPTSAASGVEWHSIRPTPPKQTVAGAGAHQQLLREIHARLRSLHGGLWREW